MNLRSRITCIYGALATVVLFVALATGYGFYERAAYRNFDGLLTVFVLTARAGLGPSNDGALEAPPLPLPLALRLYDAQGKLIRSGGVKVPSDINPPPSVGPGFSVHANWINWLPPLGSPTVALELVGKGLATAANGERWRVNTIAVDGGYLQGLYSMASVDRALATIQRRFVETALTGTLLVMVLGYLLSGASLSPLDRLSKTAQGIVQSSAFAPRLEATPGELGPLAQALNTSFASLKEWEERFRRASDATGALVYDVDLSGQRSTVVHGLEQVVGISKQAELTSDWWHARIHPEDLAAHLQNIQRHLQQGGTYQASYRVLHSDGSWIYVEDTAQIVYDAQGKPLRMVGTIVDVSVRVKAQAALQESQRQLERILDVSPSIVYIREHSTQQNLFVNRQSANMLGYTPEEVTAFGKGFLPSVMHPDDLIRTAEHEQRLTNLADGETAQFEYRLKHKAGHWIWFLSRDTVFQRDENNQAILILGTATDITERKHAEERLQHLQNVSASLSQAITLLEVRRVILDGVSSALGADGTGLYRLEEESLVLDEYDLGTRYPVQVAQAHSRLPLNTHNPAVTVIRSGEAEFIPDAQIFALRYPELAGAMQKYRPQASAYLPLKHGQKIFGVLALSFAEPRSWDQAERTFALVLADRAAVAYERARLYEEEQRARQRAEETTQRLETLYSLSSKFSKALTPAEIVQIMFEDGLRVAQAGGSVVALLSPQRDAFEIVGSSGYPSGATASWERFPLKAGIPMADVALSGEPLFFGNRAQAEQAYPEMMASGQSNHQGWALLPLWGNSGAVGAISISFAEARQFSPEDQAFLLALTRKCAQAIERAQLFVSVQSTEQEQRQLRQRLSALHQVSLELNAAASVDELCRLAVEKGRSELGFDRVGIFLLDPNNPHLMLGTYGTDGEGNTRDEHHLVGPPKAEGMRRIVLEGERFVLAPHTTNPADRGGIVAMHAMAGLWDGERIIGVISTDNLLSNQPIDERWCELLRLYSTVIAQHISRHRHLLALRENQRRLTLTMESGRMGAWDWDMTTGVQHWSPEQERLFGYSPGRETYTLQDFLSRVHPDDRQRLMIKAQQSSTRQQDFGEDEFRLLHPDGRLVWLASRSYIHRDKSGEVVRMTGVNMDITERKQAEERLRYQLQLNQLFTQTAAVSIFVNDAEGNIAFINPEAEATFGYSLEELKGKSLHEIIHYRYPDGRPFPIEECPMGMVWQDGESVRNYQGVFFRRDGSPVDMMCSSMPILQEGKAAGDVITMLNISEIKRTQSRLERLQHLTSQFAQPIEPAQVLDQIMQQSARALGAVGGVLRLLRGDRLEAVRVVSPNEHIATDYRNVSLDYNIPSAEAARTKRPLFFASKQAQIERYPHLEAVIQQFASRSAAYLPLISSQGQTLGVLTLDFPEEQSLEQDWLTFLQAIAYQAAQALERSQLFDSLGRVNQYLRESEERLRLAATATGFGSYDFDVADNIHYCSAEFMQLFGLPPDAKPTLQEIGNVVWPEDQEHFKQAVGLYMQPSDSPHFEIEYRVAHASGVRWVRDSGVVFFAGEGANQKAVRVVGTVLEITQQKLHQEELRKRAALEERQKLARDLHDSVSQALYGVVLGIQSSIKTLSVNDKEQLLGLLERVGQNLEYTQRMAATAMAEMKNLIFELRPESLEQEGLVVALRKQIEAVRLRGRYEAKISLGAEPELSLAAKEVLYRIAQESLHNIVKHAHASAIEVVLETNAQHVSLLIGDNGKGFDPVATYPGHLGLVSMKERSQLVGGELKVSSQAGKGTAVWVVVPLHTAV